MDVKTVKPVPLVQKSRKLERDRKDRQAPDSRPRNRHRDNDDDQGNKRIDTYA